MKEVHSARGERGCYPSCSEIFCNDLKLLFFSSRKYVMGVWQLLLDTNNKESESIKWAASIQADGYILYYCDSTNKKDVKITITKNKTTTTVKKSIIRSFKKRIIDLKK